LDLPDKSYQSSDLGSLAESGNLRALCFSILEAMMKSIWWAIAMLVLAFMSLLANKAFERPSAQTNATAITSVRAGSATSSQTVADR